ncbi:MAG: hypothetical protein WC375_06910 [Methanomassiliicoccales archaeon]|jgi:hypothetical protein
MNAIILPRSIELERHLNETLDNFGIMTSSNLLYNAELYYTDCSMATRASDIITLFSKTRTANMMESVLFDLTHNLIEAHMGNNATIFSTSALNLLHLPNDVLSVVPSFIENAGLGKIPYNIGIGEKLSDITDFLINTLVFITTGVFLYI